MVFCFLGLLHIPQRPSFLREQPDVAALAGKEPCPSAAGGTWRDALCAGVSPGDGMKRALPSRACGTCLGFCCQGKTSIACKHCQLSAIHDEERA